MSQCHDQYEIRGRRLAPVRDKTGTNCHDLYEPAADPELVLAREVRAWIQAIDPGDEPTARAAIDTAVSLYRSGSSVSEACEEARRRVMCRLRHPSHPAWSTHRQQAS